ncbi:hypothetical protein [Leyella stercorea]|uniref:hypothetical protein n=1 Tax=Leyella stercorea TaxID=363265 RepID=UPI00242CDE53|nr:hypothetical protein [Leyella stercorea]
MQTYVSVDADIRIGRRRHTHRSTQTSATTDADAFLTTSTFHHLNIKSHHLTTSTPHHLTIYKQQRQG